MAAHEAAVPVGPAADGLRRAAHRQLQALPAAAAAGAVPHPRPFSVSCQGRRLEEFCAARHNLALFKGKAEKLQLKLTLYAVLWYGNCFCFKCLQKLESQYLFREQIT